MCIVYCAAYNCSLSASLVQPSYNVSVLFLQSCVAAFLDVVIGGRAVETPPMSSMNLLEGLSRTAVYITHNQLLALVNYFASDSQIMSCHPGTTDSKMTKLASHMLPTD